MNTRPLGNTGFNASILGIGDLALLGLSFPNEQYMKTRPLGNFQPLSPERMAQIKELALEAVRGKGDCWWNP